MVKSVPARLANLWCLVAKSPGGARAELRPPPVRGAEEGLLGLGAGVGVGAQGPGLLPGLVGHQTALWLADSPTREPGEALGSPAWGLWASLDSFSGQGLEFGRRVPFTPGSLASACQVGGGHCFGDRQVLEKSQAAPAVSRSSKRSCLFLRAKCPPCLCHFWTSSLLSDLF